MKTRFGQVVIGPPGSGKTTYCDAMSKLLKELGREVAVVNIDPANESKKYDAAIDVFELITLEDVMENLALGPNGALMYCMEFLEKNIDWLERKISKLKDHYFIFDCPGQIELYTHHRSMKNILERLEKLDLRLSVVQLVDSHYCSDAGKFIATVLMTLSSMLQLGMPHVNVLSKIDLAEKYTDKLQFNINFYTDVLDLNYFLSSLDEDAITKKYAKLNSAIISLVEDFGLVSFLPLNVNDRTSLLKIRAAADKANGYVFGAGEERNVQALLACATGAEYEDETLRTFGEKESDDNKTETTLSDDLLWR
ncbi:UNVERIFIED_CONTAM: hypothetical protein PYX00_000436 [Menopon gallinae]|uniref:GPN-loop GTPase 2 n=1 Tax=Menopon gallinae TaxID=328185 RepID=A0AAW2I9R4_9NEOP